MNNDDKRNIGFNSLYKSTNSNISNNYKYNLNNNFTDLEQSKIFKNNINSSTTKNDNYVNELNNLMTNYVATEKVSHSNHLFTSNNNNSLNSNNNTNSNIMTNNIHPWNNYVDSNKINIINDNDNLNSNNHNVDNKLNTIKLTTINTDNNHTVNDNNIDSNKYDMNRANEIKNKAKKHNEYIYTDGLDTEDDNKNKIVMLLTNRYFLYTLSILVFIAVSLVVVKAFYFGKKIDHYEEFFTEIAKKEESKAKIYAGNEIDSDTLRKVAVDELIECIKSPVDMNNLSSGLKDAVNEINNYYNQSNNYFAFVYKDLYTGFTVSYNANQPIFTASAIKAPTDIYIYEMASQGKVDLDEMVTYTGAYYNTGSGVLKNKPINTKYSVRTLLEYSTVTSDNAAHNMLMDKYGRVNMLNFWQSKGTKAIFTENNNWGLLTANDSMIYMSELYNFYLNNEEYGSALMNNFLNSYPKFIKGKNNFKIASKSGWSGTALHDVAIIFADNPYIVVGLSNMGTSNYTSYFNQVSSLSSKLHEEYWKYKMNTCNNIKQY